MQKQLLLTAGPTPIDNQVKKILSQPITFHRTAKFIQTYNRLSDELKFLFQTKNDVVILASSGTGGMEAVIINLFSPGDKILVVENGKFSERWTSLAKTYKLEVNRLVIPWGKSVTPEQVEKKTKSLKSLKGIFFTQCETSTGALTKLETIIPQIRKHSSALIVVDAISSAAVVPLKFDDWGIDAAVTASQKGLGLPPGLAMVALSNRAWKQAEQSRLPGYYFDLIKTRESFNSGKGSPFTPAIPLILAADIVLQKIKKDGLENIWRQRHFLMRLK